MEQDTRAKLESALGFKLTSTERDILAHIEREVENSKKRPVYCFIYLSIKRIMPIYIMEV